MDPGWSQVQLLLLNSGLVYNESVLICNPIVNDHAIWNDVMEPPAEGKESPPWRIKRHFSLESFWGEKPLVYICYVPREGRQSGEILVI